MCSVSYFLSDGYSREHFFFGYAGLFRCFVVIFHTGPAIDGIRGPKRNQLLNFIIQYFHCITSKSEIKVSCCNHSDEIEVKKIHPLNNYLNMT